MYSHREWILSNPHNIAWLITFGGINKGALSIQQRRLRFLFFLKLLEEQKVMYGINGWISYMRIEIDKFIGNDLRHFSFFLSVAPSRFLRTHGFAHGPSSPIEMCHNHSATRSSHLTTSRDSVIYCILAGG